ncbi:MAG: hypothetical protein K2M75_02520 [Clostridia bacterium]|nr:hypothetical protein [Clostridia bacterium]
MKKFKILFIAVLLIGVLAASTVLCACDGNTPEDSKYVIDPFVEQQYDDLKVNIYNDGGLHLKSNNYSAMIKSVKELSAFCNEDNSPIFEKRDEMFVNQNEGIINVLKKYNKEFFKNKSLIVLFRTKGSSGYFYNFKDYSVNDAQLDITLSMKLPKEPCSYPADMMVFIYVLEFDKAKVSSVLQINVKEIQEQED